MHMPPLAIFLSALSLEKPEPTPRLPESGPAHLLPDGRSLGAHVASAWSALSETTWRLAARGGCGRLCFGEGLQHSLGPTVVICPNMVAAALRTV